MGDFGHLKLLEVLGLLSLGKHVNISVMLVCPDEACMHSAFCSCLRHRKSGISPLLEFWGGILACGIW